MKARDILNIINEGGIPSLNDWSMYAGGTSAEAGKHGYDYRDDKGTTWSIDPISNKTGKHIGYMLRTWNLSRKHRSHAWISTDGKVLGVPSSTYFKSPQEAVKMAKKVYSEVER